MSDALPVDLGLPAPPRPRARITVRPRRAVATPAMLEGTVSPLVVPTYQARAVVDVVSSLLTEPRTPPSAPQRAENGPNPSGATLEAQTRNLTATAALSVPGPGDPDRRDLEARAVLMVMAAFPDLRVEAAKASTRARCAVLAEKGGAGP